MDSPKVLLPLCDVWRILDRRWSQMSAAAGSVGPQIFIVDFAESFQPLIAFLTLFWRLILENPQSIYSNPFHTVF